MRLAVIAGDGIGPEVVAEGLKVLRSVAPDLATTDYDLGATRWQRTGELLPDTVLDELRGHDAILLGAIGDPGVPPGILERGLLLRLRFELDHHVNLRPAKLYDGVRSPLADPGAIDMLCVREGTEGPYVGNGGVLRRDTPHEVATEVSLNTAFGVERVVRYAFERATARPRRHLTLIHKTNVLTHAGSLWSRTVEEVGAEFPEVTVAYQHVDAASMFFITDPAATTSSSPTTSSATSSPTSRPRSPAASAWPRAATSTPPGTNPSMFEPVHGSAPDIAGQGVADPTATVLSVALLLDHLGRTDQARKIGAAVAFDLSTRDPQGPVRTTDVGDRLAALAGG
jgi:Isocitrate/isopropylmalate dehydrogenase